MKVIGTALLIMILAGGWSTAIAQTRVQPPFEARQRLEARPASTQGPEAPPTRERREEIRKKIESIRVWRLIEALELDDVTAARFLPLMRELMRERNDIIREDQEAMQELRGQLRAARPDERKIDAVLNRLEDNRQRLHDVLTREMNTARANLTVEQQARYIIFQQEFQREIREMLEGARRRGLGGPDPRQDRGGPGLPQDGPRRPRYQ